MHDIARRWIIAPVVAFVVIAAGVVVAPASALGAVTGTVKVNGGGVLNVRAGATTASARVGTLRNGAKVSIECQVEGQYIRGGCAGDVVVEPVDERAVYLACVCVGRFDSEVRGVAADPVSEPSGVGLSGATDDE